jgi:penicillin amidase
MLISHSQYHIGIIKCSSHYGDRQSACDISHPNGNRVPSMIHWIGTRLYFVNGAGEITHANDARRTELARYVFDTADWDNSRWIVPLGASGYLGSTHYADQTPIWAAVDLIPMTYQWDAIEAGAESHQSLKPKLRS